MNFEETGHKPVLLKEVMNAIKPKENEIYFKYNPIKKFKKDSIKKVTKKNPFEVLKNLNLR